jgi:hypothetical protein
MSGGSSLGIEGKQPLYQLRPSTRPPDVEQPQHAQEQIAHLERLGGQQALELDLLRSVSYLLSLHESTTLLLEVSTTALRAALLRYAGLDTPQHARFAVVRPDSEAKNRMVFPS